MLERCNLLKLACIQLEPYHGWLDCLSPSISTVLLLPLVINTKLRQGSLSFEDVCSLISEGCNLFSAPRVISVHTWFHPSQTTKLFLTFIEITAILHFPPRVTMLAWIAWCYETWVGLCIKDANMFGAQKMGRWLHWKFLVWESERGTVSECWLKIWL